MILPFISLIHPELCFPLIAHLRCPFQQLEELQRVDDVSERAQQPTFFTSFLPLLRKAVVTSTGIKIMHTFFFFLVLLSRGNRIRLQFTAGTLMVAEDGAKGCTSQGEV